MSSSYPTAHQIEEMFSNRTDPNVFNSYLVDNVSITVTGSNHPVSGHYNSTQHFDEAVFARLAATMKMETARTEVVRVIGGGESAWAAVETVAIGTSKLDESSPTSYIQ